MDDFAEKINSVLSDPESMKQLSELAQMFGFSTEGMAQAPSNTAPAATAPVPQSAPAQGGPDISAMMNLMGKIRDASANDNNINFLNALRPLLSEERRPKVDRAVKLLKLINILPALKDIGLLGGDFLGIL